ncbi:unnamed protein product [Lactuca saligna]|uniref:Uncharacterized protein n=1 Tax=Lactuca saligna TaxID=75948 RepID=A0AA36EJA3_LACSI|nr:unnamed protein product [Lactuca saligna]
MLRAQIDIAHENKCMDALTESTQKVKFLKEQLKNAMIELSKLFPKGVNVNKKHPLDKLQLIDAKMKSAVLKLNEVLDFTHTLAIAQQGGMMKEKEKRMKGNISSGSGKGKVNLVLEENDDLNPNLLETELKEREKRDKKLYALNILKTKIIAEEAKEKNVEETLTTKKAMFL